MKEIFVGSSYEALYQAEEVAAFLTEIPDVTPVLWNEIFELGAITFNVIEAAADRFAGAVILASPDDASNIRGRAVKVPRANLLFEYGYLAAKLTRAQVALCRWDETELPSDLAGLTYAPMGKFEKNSKIPLSAKRILKGWAEKLAPRCSPAELTEKLPATPRSSKHCAAQLTRAEEESFLARFPDWSILDTELGSSGIKRELYRRFEFPTYSLAWEFMSEVEKRGIRVLNHHPRWQNFWKCLDVWLSTSNLGDRLSCRDISLAEYFEEVWQEFFDDGKLT